MAVRPKGTPRASKPAPTKELTRVDRVDFVLDIDEGIQDLLNAKGAKTVDDLQDVVAACCLQACDCCLQVS